ncbi:YkgJ family cysteine cluster protein [bacterium]|nr:YkgJ family cysteine cluster protein [bacterium]
MKYEESFGRMVSMKSLILSKFKCKQTGACCRDSGYVRVNSVQIQKMASVLEIDVAYFLNNFTIKKNGWTLIAAPNYRPDCFLDENNRCTVYEGRPAACKSYPNWSTIWDSDESLLKEAALCKGLENAIEIVKSEKKIN